WARADDAVLDLSRAAVLTPQGLAGPERTAVRMLVDEVEKRTMLRWERVDQWPGGGTPVVVVGPIAAVRPILAGRGVNVPDQPAGREGYRIGAAAGRGAPV